MSDLQFHFSDPQTVARYTEGPPRYVPGLHDLHRMTAILLAEQAPETARILVLGAGGGMEMRAMADACPQWRFDGVDPSVQMLDLARRTLGPHAGRADLHTGYIEDAPEGPFDAATCLLTLHFLAPEERRRTLVELRRRLRPGAPLVVVHSSFPQDDRTRWLSRYAAFALASGAPPDQVANAHAAVTANLQTLSPDHDEAILREAGFSSPTLFYAAFTWRGWIVAA